MNILASHQQIIDSEKTLLQAFQNSDVETLSTLLHDEVRFVIPTGQLLDKATVLNNYRSGNSAMSSITASEQDIQMIDDTAVVSMVLALNGKYNDQVFNRKFRYLRTWKLVNGKWLVIAVSGAEML